MKAFACAIIVFLAGCSAGPSSTAPAEIDSPQVRPTKELVLTNCTGASPILRVPKAIFPWGETGSWAGDPLYPYSEATFAGFVCEKVDAFGLHTFENLSLAFQAHNNVGDREGRLDDASRSGLLSSLALHVSEPRLAEMLSERGWAAELGTVFADPNGSAVWLETDEGNVVSRYQNYDEPFVAGSDELDPRQYAILTSQDPFHAVLVYTEMAAKDFSAQTSLTADRGTALGEWDLVRTPMADTALGHVYVESRIVIEFRWSE